MSNFINSNFIVIISPSQYNCRLLSYNQGTIMMSCFKMLHCHSINTGTSRLFFLNLFDSVTCNLNPLLLNANTRLSSASETGTRANVLVKQIDCVVVMKPVVPIVRYTTS